MESFRPKRTPAHENTWFTFSGEGLRWFLTTRGLGDSRRQLWSFLLGMRRNVMLKKSSWPLTFPTALGVGGGLLYLQWETFLEVKGCSAQHTRRTMHTKDVFGDWACRKSYELMNNIKWRQNPNEDLNIFLGEPVTAKNWKYYWEKAVASNRTLRNLGDSLRVSVYKLGFLVGKGYCILVYHKLLSTY